MPQVVTALAPIAINLAIGVGASLLAGVFNPQQQSQNIQPVSTRSGMSFEIEVGAATAVSAILGLGRASGQLLYVNEYGANNEYFQMVIKIGHGWHDGLEHFLVDEKPVSLAGSNADPHGRSVVDFTRSGTPYLWVKTYTGGHGQTADAELVSRSSPAGRWTANHKVTGCAYMIITARYDADFFGSTVPRFGSVWRGLKMHDWRVPGAIWGDQSTYVFSKNPVVIRHNFRRGIWVNGVRVLGQGFAAYANDMSGYTAAANRCDEPFYDPVSGKTFPIFEFGRQVSDDEEKLSVLSELDDAYCGASFKRGGADVPLPAQQMVSVMTLADVDRLGGKSIRVDRKGSVSTKKTMWHGQFVNRDIGWSESPFTPRIDGELETLIGGRRAAVLNQQFESLQERAQLRAEIALRRQFYPASRIETFTPKALVLEPGDAVTRVCEWGSMLMVVEKTEPLPDKTGVTVTLTQWNNAIVPASGDSFVDLPAGPGAGQSSPNRTIAVSGLSVTPYGRESGGAVLPFLRATWTQITDPNVDQVMVRIWPTSGTEANDHEDFFADAKLSTTRLCGPVAPLTEYTGYALPIRRDGRVTVRTNNFVVTSGAQQVPIESLPDDSIAIGKLVQEMRNRMALVVGDLPERLAQLEREQAEQASANFTESTNNRKRTSVLKARLAKAVAAVLREELVRAEGDAALAMALQQVIADVDGLSASGLIRLEARVAGGGATATIAIMVRVGDEDEFIDSGILIKATKVGGVTSSELLFLAEKAFFTDGVNTKNAIRLDGATGDVIFKTGRFERLRSIDGVSIDINGVDDVGVLVGS